MLIAVSNYLTKAKQRLTIFSFQKLFLFWKISIKRSKNKKRTIKKAETLKIPMVNPFITYIVINI